MRIRLFKKYLKKNGTQKFEENWMPSEQNALQKLKDFLKKKLIIMEQEEMYRLIMELQSCHHILKMANYMSRQFLLSLKNITLINIILKKFLTEIGWREFNHSLINFFPYMLKENYSKKFDKFPWQKDKALLNSWKTGNTGYPIVDAGMKELYETGWMHNRVRMIVGSF